MARVLVIDDDPTLRQLIVSTLQKGGHEAVPAASGREAASLLKLQAVDLLITDLIMPDDSLDHVLILRAEYPQLPLILISGLLSTSLRVKEATAALRARRTLPKPFKLPDLLAATAAVLAEETARAAAARRT